MDFDEMVRYLEARPDLRYMIVYGRAEPWWRKILRKTVDRFRR